MGSTSPLDFKHVEKKLQNLSNTRESIQNLSMWALSHKAQHEQIVAIWFQVLKTAKIELRLCLFYLCNDIVQTCRREHALVFKDAFKDVLKDAALLVRDASVRSSVKRIFKIWLERKVYDEAFVKELLATLYNTKVKSSLSSKLLDGFHPENLKKSISGMAEMEERIELQRVELSEHIWSKEELDNFKQGMKNRNQGEEVVRELENMRSKYKEYVSSLEEERCQRKDLILMLELSELFYDAQLGECNILSTAYKAYNTKLNNVKKKLWEFIHPEDREMEQLKKMKKKKTKFPEEAIKSESLVADGMGSVRHSGPNAEAISGMPMTDQHPDLPPPSVSTDVWTNATITKMEPNSFPQQFHIDHSRNLHDDSKFYQQPSVHQQDIQKQRSLCLPNQLCSSYAISTTATLKASNMLVDDCYEMNHYEIGGDECTPVYDEDVLEGGDATPVQDEDPDGYITAKDHKRSYLGLEVSKENKDCQAGVFMGMSHNAPLRSSNSMSSLNPQVHFPLGCIPPTPDLTRPPPPLNIFFSPNTASSLPGILRNATPNLSDKEKLLGDNAHGQNIHPQVMPLHPGMFPLVGLPIPSTISSPTLPQFGMMPYAGTALTSQQKQPAQTPSNFSHLLPNMGQASLIPQLNIPPPGLPFQQQLMSPPLVATSLQAMQQLQNSQKQQSSHLPLQTFSASMKNISHPKPILIPDDQKSSDFSGRHSPSSLPVLQRTKSTNEAHFQSVTYNKKNGNDNQLRAMIRGSAQFSEGDANRSKLRINQNNLTQVKTVDNMHASLYSSHST